MLCLLFGYQERPIHAASQHDTVKMLFRPGDIRLLLRSEEDYVRLIQHRGVEMARDPKAKAITVDARMERQASRLFEDGMQQVSDRGEYLLLKGYYIEKEENRFNDELLRRDLPVIAGNDPKFRRAAEFFLFFVKKVELCVPLDSRRTATVLHQSALSSRFMKICKPFTAFWESKSARERNAILIAAYTTLAQNAELELLRRVAINVRPAVFDGKSPRAFIDYIKQFCIKPEGEGFRNREDESLEQFFYRMRSAAGSFLPAEVRQSLDAIRERTRLCSTLFGTMLCMEVVELFIEGIMARVPGLSDLGPALKPELENAECEPSQSVSAAKTARQKKNKKERERQTKLRKQRKQATESLDQGDGQLKEPAVALAVPKDVKDNGESKETESAKDTEMQSEVVLGMSMSAETEILDSPGADAADRIITHKKKKKNKKSKAKEGENTLKTEKNEEHLTQGAKTIQEQDKLGPEDGTPKSTSQVNRVLNEYQISKETFNAEDWVEVNRKEKKKMGPAVKKGAQEPILTEKLERELSRKVPLEERNILKGAAPKEIVKNQSYADKAAKAPLVETVASSSTLEIEANPRRDNSHQKETVVAPNTGDVTEFPSLAKLKETTEAGPSSKPVLKILPPKAVPNTPEVKAKKAVQKITDIKASPAQEKLREVLPGKGAASKDYGLIKTSIGEGKLIKGPEAKSNVAEEPHVSRAKAESIRSDTLAAQVLKPTAKEVESKNSLSLKQTGGQVSRTTAVTPAKHKGKSTLVESKPHIKESAERQASTSDMKKPNSTNAEGEVSVVQKPIKKSDSVMATPIEATANAGLHSSKPDSRASGREVVNKNESPVTVRTAETSKKNIPIELLGEDEKVNTQLADDGKRETTIYTQSPRVQSTPAAAEASPAPGTERPPTQNPAEAGNLVGDALQLRYTQIKAPAQQKAASSSQVDKGESSASKKASEDRPSQMKLRATAPSFEPANKTLPLPVRPRNIEEGTEHLHGTRAHEIGYSTPSPAWAMGASRQGRFPHAAPPLDMPSNSASPRLFARSNAAGAGMANHNWRGPGTFATDRPFVQSHHSNLPPREPSPPMIEIYEESRATSHMDLPHQGYFPPLPNFRRIRRIPAPTNTQPKHASEAAQEDSSLYNLKFGEIPVSPKFVDQLNTANATKAVEEAEEEFPETNPMPFDYCNTQQGPPPPYVPSAHSLAPWENPLAIYHSGSPVDTRHGAYGQHDGQDDRHHAPPRYPAWQTPSVGEFIPQQWTTSQRPIMDRPPNPMPKWSPDPESPIFFETDPFYCAFCYRTVMHGKSEVCPGCGPMSYVRFCNRPCMFAARDHWKICGRSPFTRPFIPLRGEPFFDRWMVRTKTSWSSYKLWRQCLFLWDYPNLSYRIFDPNTDWIIFAVHLHEQDPLKKRFLELRDNCLSYQKPQDVLLLYRFVRDSVKASNKNIPPQVLIDQMWQEFNVDVSRAQPWPITEQEWTDAGYDRARYGVQAPRNEVTAAWVRQHSMGPPSKNTCGCNVHGCTGCQNWGSDDEGNENEYYSDQEYEEEPQGEGEDGEATAVQDSEDSQDNN